VSVSTLPCELNDRLIDSQGKVVTVIRSGWSTYAVLVSFCITRNDNLFKDYDYKCKKNLTV